MKCQNARKHSRKGQPSERVTPRHGNVKKQKRDAKKEKTACEGRLYAENCQKKCSSKVNLDTRQRLFMDFYSKN